MLTTKTKLAIARNLNRFILGWRNLFRLPPFVTAKRKDITWHLDLNEGIDLAIYLGRYQQLPPRLLQDCVRADSLVIDIGANIGAHALPLAKSLGPNGRIIAVEPTRFAFRKLLANLHANPDISNRVIAVQAALTDGAPLGKDAKFYSRWPLGGKNAEQHPEHLGILEGADGGRSLTLDALLDELRTSNCLPSRIAFVKLDVDGNELSVLKGAMRTFERDRPIILIEIAPHVQDEIPLRFESMLELLRKLGYRLENAETGAALPHSATELRSRIKFGASVDAVARPD